MRVSINNKFWNFKSESNNEASLDLYGEIATTSWWGDEVTPKEFKNELDKLGNIEVLNIYINSGGGEVFAGQAIYSMLKRHNSLKRVYIDGVAASIASVIAMVGDEIIMPSNAMLMIHNPYTFAVGNANEFRKIADDMDKIRETIVSTYINKSGMDKDKIIDYMDNETWFYAAEALELGLIDKIDEKNEMVAKISNNNLYLNNVKCDFSKYNNVPDIKTNKNESEKDEPKKVEPFNEAGILIHLNKNKQRKFKYNV